jgi:hypothetical protein
VPQPSSIELLPLPLRQAVEKAIREGRLPDGNAATIDALVSMVGAHGHQVSRSAMGRHRKTVAEEIEDFRQQQQLAKLWMDQARENPDGDVGQVVGELLKIIAMGTARELRQAEEPADPKQIRTLAAAIKDLAMGDRHRTKLRAELLAETKRKLDEVAKDVKGQPQLEEMLRRIRRDVYGLED